MKKIVTILTTIAIFCLVIFSFGAKAETQSGVTMANGASIRANGDKQGLKFSATVSSLENSTEHGFYIVIGSPEKDSLVRRINNGYTTILGSKITKVVVNGTNPRFHAVIYGIPESYYTQKITAIAYVKYADSVEYSDVAITRSISEIAVKQHQHNYENDLESPEIIQAGFDASLTKLDWGCTLEDTFKIGQYENYAVDETYHDGWGTVVSGSTTQYISFGNEVFLDDPNGSNANMTLNYGWYRILIKKVDDQTGVYKSVYATHSGESFSDTEYPYASDGTGAYDYIIGAYFGTDRTVTEEVDIDRNKIKEYVNIVKNGGEVYFNFGSDIPNSRNLTSTEKINWDKTVGVLTSFTTGAYAEGETLPTPENNPTGNTLERVGYTFNGWYDALQDETVIAQGKSKELIASWSLNTYQITYNNVEESEMPIDYPTEYTYESGEVILPIPEKDGLIFKGWYLDENFEDEVVHSILPASTGEKVFYAKWSTDAETTVTYNLNGGEVEPAYSFEIYNFQTYNNDTLGKVTILTRSLGYVTKHAGRILLEYDEETGMYKSVSALLPGDTHYSSIASGQYILGAYPSTKDTTLYPNQTNSYSGQYNLEAANTILEIVRYVYAGNTVYFDITIPSSGNGSWQEDINAYTDLTLVNNNVITYTEDEETLPQVQKEGYAFDGWYKNSDFTGNEVTAISSGDPDMNLYAKFTPIEYTISYNLGDGSTYDVELITTYTIESDTIILPTAENMAIDGGVFTHFIDSGSNEVTEIQTGSTGDIELTAVWDMTSGPTTTITYELNGGTLPNYFEFVLDNFNTYSDLGSGADNGITTKARVNSYMNYTWWRILIKYNNELGLWESVQAPAQGVTGLTLSTDYTYVIGGHNNNTNTTALPIIKAAHAFVAAGNTLYFDLGTFTPTNVPTATASWDQVAKASSDPTLLKNKTIVYSQETLELPKVIRNGYGFAGWYDNPEFIGEPITSIDVLNYHKTITLYAKWEHGVIEVGEGKEYSTISSALEAAEAGSIIKVYAGTYNESFAINKAITIIGPNKDALSNTSRVAEANITGTITINVSNVEINGIELSGEQTNVKFVNDISNITLKSIFVSKDVDYSSSVVTFYMASTSDSISNLLVDNCTFISQSSISGFEGEYRPIKIWGITTDSTFTNNYFTFGTEHLGYTEMIYLNTVSGNIDISNNNLYQCTSYQWSFATPNVQANSYIKVENNIIDGVSREKGAGAIVIGHTSMGSNVIVEAIGNQIYYATGYVFRVNDAAENVIYRYNVMIDCDVVIRKASLDNLIYQYNYAYTNGELIDSVEVYKDADTYIGTILDSHSFTTAEDCRNEYRLSREENVISE